MTNTEKKVYTLRDRLEADLVRAESNSPCSVEAATLRLVLCAVHDRDAEARAHDTCEGCDDKVIKDVLQLMVRQRETTAADYENAGRIDMADNEREEIDVILRYLPKPMDETALNAAVESVIGDLQAQSLKDLGRCMNELKSRYSDDIDARKAGKLVKKALCG
jgi:uncharacterized protein